ncbi:MAG TPA: type II secretion system F family protein [Actinomycetales bacterium]|nr:type II secretion system F family protein [Actinomycetales bacterium]
MRDLTIVAALLLAAAVVVWPRPPAERAGRLRPLAGSRPGPRPASRATGSLSVALVIQLVAAAMDAGLPAPQAVEAAARAAGPSVWSELEASLRLWRLGETAAAAWDRVDTRWRPLVRCLVLSDTTGVSAAAVLRAAARDLREARRRVARVDAHRLGVRLVLPLGLTTLPAFVLCAVVPVVLGLAGSVLVGD